ncbi:Na(+)-linked D-alanine glycine permease [hydrothermal vent metagenome]|uniref:Na(+)-linked D-alanine glycine permease n=1 Tax=hydrothermal vent metagenome TaxID=652676 RepID=A0A3B0RP72_9ZZZZ
MTAKLKKIILGIALLPLLIPTSAQAFEAGNFDEALNNFIQPFTSFYAKYVFFPIEINGQDLPLIVVWLAAGSIFCTFYFKFINIRGFKTALKIVRGDYTNKDSAGEVTHFQALSAALSGTVGLGNIGGVAVAISLGGPGATVWMIIVGLFGMSAKFAECTLGVRYRVVHEDGSVSGGPMYYLKQGFAEKGWPRLGMALAISFSIFTVFASFGGGNIFQISQTVEQFQIVTAGHTNFFFDYRWVFGLGMAILVGMVIIGGIRSIAKVTSKLVPIMCVFYLIAALSILLGRYEQIPEAFMAIINGAFTPEAGYGGLIGVMIQGMRRATFSNEAGIGSAPIAHAAVKTSEPATEGLVSLLEPFIDTVIVCTMTALVIVITGVYQHGNGLSGVKLTSEAFSSAYSWFPIVLAIAVLLFAFSTMITWSYYGIKAWTFLFGESKKMEITYKVLFCSVTVIGATMSLTEVVNFSDAANFSMAIPNLIGVFVLAPVVRQCLISFMDKIKSGEIKSNREVEATESI